MEEVGSSETINRPMLNEVRDRVKAKEIRCLLVYRLDRLSRKVTNTERLLKEFQFHDLILIEAHNGRVVDYSDHIGNKLTAVMNDLYLEQSKQVLNAGKIKSVSLYGNHLGEAPLGYTYDRVSKKLVPNEDKHIIEEIYDLYLHDMNLFDVAVEMNKRGYKTRDGNIFTHKTIMDTLTNEKYIGTQIYGKRKWFKDENGKKVSKPAPESEWIIYPNAHEPIIIPETFQKVADKLKDNRIVDVNSRKRTYGLTNVIKCGICVRNITFYKDSNNGKTYMKPCANIDFTTGKRCPNGAVALSIIDDFIHDKLLNEVKPVIAYYNIVQASELKMMDTTTAKIKDLNDEKKEINKQLDNLLDLQLARGVDQRLIDQENKLKYSLQKVEEQLASIDVDTDRNGFMEKLVELHKDFLNQPYNWQSEDCEVKNMTIKKYIDKIVYTREISNLNKPKLEIHYTDEVKQGMELFKQAQENSKASTKIYTFG
ncbi:recombinase family protein [Pseudobacteroides cellulosolvens]|nr:recombinase family protein [Pseudobacteroides cellulosolvens]